MYIMKKYPKIGIRPTIDGRQGGVRESLEDKTMNLAKSCCRTDFIQLEKR